MTATEVFESVTGSGASDFALLVRILDQHGPWCLIGGLAVNCYVEPVFTLDADVVVATAELGSIQAELLVKGFSVTEYKHPVNAQMKGSQLRIQFTLDQPYQKFLSETKVMNVLGERVPVASLENVVRGKIWSWTDPERGLTKRKKDELDLIRIAVTYPELHDMMTPLIRAQLEER